MENQSRQNGVASNGHSPPTPTDAATWMQAYAGIVVTLPSGLRVRLRPVDLITLVMDGHVPDRLTPVVADMIYEPGAGTDEYDAVERALHVRREQMPVINAVCKAAFLEPRIVDDPATENGITLDSLPVTDRIRAAGMVMSGVDHLRKFRDQPAPTVAPAPDGEPVEPEAEPTGGDTGA
jgi:hypothetical protein